eukprot:3086350-Ditylum_brightwellii.AAC.1
MVYVAKEYLQLNFLIDKYPEKIVELYQNVHEKDDEDNRINFNTLHLQTMTVQHRSDAPKKDDKPHYVMYKNKNNQLILYSCDDMGTCSSLSRSWKVVDYVKMKKWADTYCHIG